MNKNKCILIREFTEDDIENKVKWINDPLNNEFLHYELPLEYDKTKNWFHNRDIKHRRDFVIEYENIPVGLIGLLNIDYESQKAEYYISIGEENYKGRGVATEASLIILKYAFEELKLNKVFLNVDAKNLAACGLYEKLGFFKEGFFSQELFHRGELIDRIRYAIFKDTWEERVNLI